LTCRQQQVKFSRDFEIPADFPEILRDLTREILRANPTDIDKFGASLLPLLAVLNHLHTSFPPHHHLPFFSLALDFFEGKMLEAAKK
jgi:hypothetical protein